MSKDRRLGRGLAALLGTPLEDELHAEAIAAAAPTLSDPRPPPPDSRPAEGAGGLLQLPVGEIVFQSVIPRDVAAAEAPSHGRCVMDYAPRSRATRGYIELCMEVLERE